MKKVLVGGVFNVIHPGHIYFLTEAKKRGDYLVVVIASDKTAGVKGIYPAETRKKLVESLGFVDKVVIGSDNDKMDIVRKEKPVLVVLGYDQVMRIENVPVKRIQKFGDYSTREILNKRKKRK
jgi:FAD synthetase